MGVRVNDLRIDRRAWTPTASETRSVSRKMGSNEEVEHAEIDGALRCPVAWRGVQERGGYRLASKRKVGTDLFLNLTGAAFVGRSGSGFLCRSDGSIRVALAGASLASDFVVK